MRGVFAYNVRFVKNENERFPLALLFLEIKEQQRQCKKNDHYGKWQMNL